MNRVVLQIEPLTAQAFRSYGDVIEARPDARHYPINRGSAERFHDLAFIDTAAKRGRSVVSIVRALPRTLPLRITVMERHAWGSQAFVPLSGHPFLAVVAPAGHTPDSAAVRCFVCTAGQGVNYASGTWHHPLLALDAASDFLVIDRAGAADEVDCEEVSFEAHEIWIPAIDGRSAVPENGEVCSRSV